jgi:hypothetical protein
VGSLVENRDWDRKKVENEMEFIHLMNFGYIFIRNGRIYSLAMPNREGDR